MAEFDRRALLGGGLATIIGVTSVHAQEKDEETDIPVEFDGKVKNNPKCIGPGKVKVTGVCRVPAGHKLEKVEVTFQTTQQMRKGVHQAKDAITDESKTPITWSVEIENIEPDGYWFDTRFHFTDGKDTLVHDGREKRYVGVKGPAKK